MNLPNSSRHHELGTRPTRSRPPGNDHSGALVLALLAAAAFCGWYILARELPGDSGPPAIVEAPQIIPPATTDLADDLPGHTHYTVFVSKDQASASKAPQAGLIPSKP